MITTDLLRLVCVQVASGGEEPHLAGWDIIATQLQASKLTIGIHNCPHNIANTINLEDFGNALDPGPYRGWHQNP